MPRRAIDLEPYKNDIIRIFQNNTIDAVVYHLENHHQLHVKKSTVKDWLRRWGVRKLNPKVTSNAELHARIQVLFHQVGLEEEEMMHVLHLDGYVINRRTLRRLRKQLGLSRRADPALAQKQADSVLKSLKEEFGKGIIEGYGRRMLHRHFRTELGIVISRLVNIYTLISRPQT